jgi:drug/metabolite transporter (DMT)-like permease
MVFLTSYGGIAYLIIAPFVPFPEPALWGWIFASVCFHMIYQISITKMHEHNPLSFAYPIARGTGPLIVTLVSYFFLGEILSNLELLFIAILIGGIFLTIQVKDSDGERKIIFPILAGFMIASYTMIDGTAMKLADTPVSFIVWSNIASAPLLFAFAYRDRGRAIIRSALSVWRMGIPITLIAHLGYAAALYAYRMGTLGEIAALRETSILFAAIIGYFWLKEPINGKRWAALALILTGTLTLALT